MSRRFVVTVAVAVAAAALAQAATGAHRAPRSRLGGDPAGSWVTYLTAACPPGEFMQRFSCNYVVPPPGRPTGLPPSNAAAYQQAAIWPGIEQHNLNLLQPILQLYANPTNFTYQTYSEWFDWHGFKNKDSAMYAAAPGDLLFSDMQFVDHPTTPGYNVCQHNLAATPPTTSCLFGTLESAFAPYLFDRAYLVLEHHFTRCDMYPPSDSVTFFNVTTVCGAPGTAGRRVTLDWTAHNKRPECGAAAHVWPHDATQFTLTWNSSAPSANVTSK